MTRENDVLERLAPLSGTPNRGFEDLLRLRAKRQLSRKVGAIAVVAALVVALVGIALNETGDRPAKLADQPDSAQTFEGMVIRYTGNNPYEPYEGSRNLIVQDPATGETRPILQPRVGDALDLAAPIYDAAISSDGRWIAFDVHTECGDQGPALWVTNAVDEPRRLTRPCANSSDDDELGLWEWSPSGARLLVVLGTPASVILVDPASGDRTDLGQVAGEVTSLAWSPDGSRFAYAMRGSVYTGSVNGGEHAVIAESLGSVPGGEEGAGIAWSPDGRRIAVLTDDGRGFPGGPLYVMNTDGSNRRLLAGNVHIEHILGSPNVVWSPDGSRLAYASLSDERTHLRIWSAALDGSAPVRVYNEADHPRNAFVGGPVWSPDGTLIAFRDDSTNEQHRWLVANAEGNGDVEEIDELQPLSWRPSRYFCECYG